MRKKLTELFIILLFLVTVIAKSPQSNVKVVEIPTVSTKGVQTTEALCSDEVLGKFYLFLLVT